MMSEKPSNKRIELSNLGLTSNIVEFLVSNVEAARFYRETLSELALRKGSLGNDDRKLVANYLTSDLWGFISQDKKESMEVGSAGAELSFRGASPELFAKLISLIIDGSITSRVAKDIIPEVVFTHIDPEVLAKERGLLQQGSEADLIPVIDTVLKEHAEVVAAYKSGKESSLQFLIGQCMKATRGSANPGVLSKLLKERIASIS